MSFFIELGQVVRAQFYCSMNAQLSINSRYWILAVASGVTQIPSQSLADHLSTQVSGLFKDAMSENATYRGTRVSQTETPATLKPSDSIIGFGAGTVLANALPSQCAGLIRYSSNNAGRRGEGRNYIPFATSEDITATGDCAAGYGLKLVAIAGELGAPQVVAVPGGSGTFNPVLWSRTMVGPPPNVTTSTTATGFATQRKRGYFGKTNSFPF